MSPDEADAVRREASRLAGMGVGAFVLDRQAEGSNRLALLLEAALGPGQDYGRFTTWPL
ncbi:MAG: hypothetical protein GY913_22490 [Proteobacteria bacterium]|nr:hypothetical protein [Pseudomonadota bacterium]MCP4919679.1 hypothetical protein [Pseudomonadota bacterium]